MDLPLSRATVSLLDWRGSTASTNADLLAAAADPELPSWSVVATDDQTAGRGRLDRSWVAPAGTALAISVLVRGALAAPRASWIPLIAGLAMAEAIAAAGPAGRVGIKWPNDVLLDGRKVCGILVEGVPGTPDVVVGAGVNLTQRQEELPRLDATSLALAGVRDVDADRLLADYLTTLRALLDPGRDAEGIRAAVIARCLTVGTSVRVERPEGVLLGTARDLDEAGRLVVVDGAGSVHAVAAGDVVHVRPDPSA